MLKSYEKKNVFFVEVLGGDEEIPNIDFKKHYRLSCPVIPDNLDRYRHIIRVSGITNVGVFGGDGVCVFNKAFMGEDGEGGFESVIDEALAKIKGPGRKEQAFLDRGTVYAPQVKQEGKILHQRAPDIAAGPGGELFVVYESDYSGSSDVILRSSSGGTMGKEVKVAATKADEYSPAVIVAAKGVALVAYISNASGRYDIYTTLVKDGKAQKAQQVTRSPDDAMAPSLARGPKGDIWLAWYEWRKMGPLSRDREVFVSRLEAAGWSNPLQVSPREVPAYEDHADPAVASDGQGGAWVAWAWDYHGTLRGGPPVEENSIFVRHVDSGLALGTVLGAGFRGKGRARDYMPTLAVARDGTPWVAWDNSHKASAGNDAKALFVNRLQGKDFGEQVEAASVKGRVDSPGLLVDPKGGLHLLWAQEAGREWELWLRSVGPKDQGQAQKLPIKGKSPRHPRGCFDAKGRLWVAYTDATSPRWEVRAELAGK